MSAPNQQQFFALTQRAALAVARATRGLDLKQFEATVAELLATDPPPPLNEHDALVLTGKLCAALLAVQALVPDLEALAERFAREHGVLHPAPKIITLNGHRGRHR